VAELISVPASEVEASWHLAESWVARAVEEGALIETVEGYKARCIDGTAQLWLIRDEIQVFGAMISEVYETARGRTCAAPVVSAVSLDDVLVPLFQEFERYARSHGCSRLEGFGRLGWIRALKPHGWRAVAVVIEKDI
jgi:hypothetical protein